MKTVLVVVCGTDVHERGVVTQGQQSADIKESLADVLVVVCGTHVHERCVVTQGQQSADIKEIFTD